MLDQILVWFEFFTLDQKKIFMQDQKNSRWTKFGPACNTVDQTIFARMMNFLPPRDGNSRPEAGKLKKWAGNGREFLVGRKFRDFRELGRKFSKHSHKP
jgi:hypothetical protein